MHAVASSVGSSTWRHVSAPLSFPSFPPWRVSRMWTSLPRSLPSPLLLLSRSLAPWSPTRYTRQAILLRKKSQVRTPTRTRGKDGAAPGHQADLAQREQP